MSDRLAGRASLPIIVLAVCLLTAPAQGFAEPKASVILRFHLEVMGAPAQPLKGSLELRPTSGDGRPVKVAVEAAIVAVAVDARSSWEVSTEIPGSWAARVSVVAGEPGTETSQRLDVWPLGTISGRVKSAQKGVKLPERVQVTTLAAPVHLRRPAVPKGLLECPVAPDGSWSCTLPAADFDLSVGAAGFVPKYLWGIKVPAGKTLPLGTFDLRRGASLAGWVTVEEGVIDPAVCRARLARMPSPSAGMMDAASVAGTIGEGSVGRDGFFQLSGLAPGFYQLEIRQSGYAPAQVEPVRIAQGAETIVGEPVVLKRPLRVELSIAPPLDWLARPWHVEVMRPSDASARFDRPVFDAAADLQGQITLLDQAPGRFLLRVRDSLGNSLYQDRNLEIESAADARQSISIPLVTVEGKILLGRDPLAATLWFGLRDGPQSIKMESDAEGRFHGVLPRDGRWPVQVSAAEPKLATVTDVRTEADKAGRVRLEITLPDTRLFGRVVDPYGQPAPQAEVELVSGAASYYATADAQGGFELRGFPEGPAALAAFGAGGTADAKKTSPRVQVDATDGEVGPVELRLRATKDFSGIVRTALGPGAGAMVSVQSEAADGLLDSKDSAFAGAEGEFKVQLAEGAASAAILVSAPGQALKAFHLPVGREPADLRVTERGGTLEIGRTAVVGQQSSFPLDVFQNGIWIPTSVLLRWVMGHNGRLPSESGAVFRVPEVAPGEYRVCSMPLLTLLTPPSAGSPNQPRCAAGTLTAGGTLRLEIK